jgi:hypothetical protein
MNGQRQEGSLVVGQEIVLLTYDANGEKPAGRQKPDAELSVIFRFGRKCVIGASKQRDEETEWGKEEGEGPDDQGWGRQV